MTRPWPEEYYDIVDHYFWAPDRLGHLSNPLRALKKPAEIMARLRRIEEPLNHILGIFFAIAPSSFVQELYRTHTGIEIDVPLRLLGRDIHKAFGINDATQPDFAFQGPSSFVTLEAKVAGRSSTEQLLKYALLHWRVAAASRPTQQALLYLSDAASTKLFLRGFVDWPSMKAKAIADLPSLRRQAFERLSEDERRQVAMTLEVLPIAHITYAELDSLMAKWEAKARAIDADGAEAKLFSGVRHELKRRGLV